MHENQIEFRYLRAFLTVGETRSFTETAKRMKVAQSAVSRQIKLLEESLRVQLFVRSNQGVFLTPLGEKFYQRAKSFSDWCDHEFVQLTPEIRIGSIQGVFDTWLIDRIARMGSKIQGHLNIKVMNDEAIAKSLENNQIDIGFTAREIHTGTLTSRKLFEERFCLVSREKVDLKRLHEYTWISSERAYYLNKLSKRLPARHLKVGSTDAIQKLVAAGLGIAILPEHVVHKDLGLRMERGISIPRGAVYLSMPAFDVVPTYLKDFLSELES
jgi:DNA-binding transcriptional LysR family regulator